MFEGVEGVEGVEDAVVVSALKTTIALSNIMTDKLTSSMSGGVPSLLLIVVVTSKGDAPTAPTLP